MRSFIIRLMRIVPDKLYLKMMFYKHFKRNLNFKRPETFSEKLQWLKMNDRKPEYTVFVDKYKVREYIKGKIGEEYLVPLLGVWNDASSIDFSKLPNQFVLKCNHDSKSTIICRDKSQLNKQQAVEKLNKRLNLNAYWYGREWPYKNVKPLVIAEQYLKSEKDESLTDYKVLCFNGKAKYVQVYCGRGTDHYTLDYYDMEWNIMRIEQKGIKLTEQPLKKPVFLDEMISLSEVLAKELIHARIDWYYVNGQLYFGEITFFDGSGFVPFLKEQDDTLLGNLIKLPIDEGNN